MAELTPPTSGLSDWQLKLSYFYVSNKLLLRKLYILLLILISCLFWGYSIFGLAIWALDYSRLDHQTKVLMFSSAEVLPAVEALRPKSLNLSGVESFSGNEGRFDLMAYVENPNSDWLAIFNYAFIGNNASTTYFSSFALPGQQKFLLDLGKENSDGQLELDNVKWIRITDFSNLKINRERFAVNDIEFLPAEKSGDPSRVKFIIENESSYGFWDAGIVVLLHSGSNIVGVNFLTIPQFKTGDKRPVEMNWIRSLPAIDEVEVIPEVNYIDPKNVMPTSAF
jgi:hypothetical protein